MLLKQITEKLRVSYKRCLFGALLTVTVGLLLLVWAGSFGELVQQISYDLPIAARYAIGSPRPSEAVMVVMDEESHRQLGQNPQKIWDRGLHGELVNKLKEYGAKVIVFDVVFIESTADAESFQKKELSEEDQYLAKGTQKFADAIRAHGRVVVGTQLTMEDAADATGGQLRSTRLSKTPDAIWKSGAAIGDVGLSQDGDYVVRWFATATDKSEGLALKAAELWGAKISQDPTNKYFGGWVNYYGPPGTVPFVPYYKVLTTPLNPELFRGKTVFVGQKMQVLFSGELKDTFGTAFTRFGDGFSAGTEIHATIFMNLLHMNWLDRLTRKYEILLIVAVGFIFGFGLMAFNPIRASITAILSAAVLVAVFWLLFQHYYVWFAWLIVLIQIFVAVVNSITVNSFFLYLERRLLADSLARHVSPGRVKQILEDPDMLKPGAARQQEISIMFSDLADFSKLAEKTTPKELFEILNDYFEAALSCLYRHDATVMMLIGDAIYAIWNAPYEQADHKERACRAALELQRNVVQFKTQKEGVILRTRVGVHVGTANVGNLGSSMRFEYTAIGESVNLASRLEGLNKYLGTSVLITGDIHMAVAGKMVTRFVGKFIFKGFSKPAEIYEPLGEGSEEELASRAWRELFSAGWAAFAERRWDDAENLFHQAIQKRNEAEPKDSSRGGRDDGPSKYYLDHIRHLREVPPHEGWHGEIEMEGK